MLSMDTDREYTVAGWCEIRHYEKDKVAFNVVEEKSSYIATSTFANVLRRWEKGPLKFKPVGRKVYYKGTNRYYYADVQVL